jgi:hypothetical protein
MNPHNHSSSRRVSARSASSDVATLSVMLRQVPLTGSTPANATARKLPDGSRSILPRTRSVHAAATRWIQEANLAGEIWVPRQDSNLRSRLRSAVTHQITTVTSMQPWPIRRHGVIVVLAGREFVPRTAPRGPPSDHSSTSGFIRDPIS